MKILIAEDDLISRKFLERVLTEWGYEVITASDGYEAWKILNLPDAPNLIILDWMMPEMDGVEVCKRLRQLDTYDMMYIILLTSLDSKDKIVEGLEAGANDYIPKPFNNSELRARIRVGERVIELQSALVEREKLKGVLEMAGAVCHEFNQPLQVIKGYAELLLMEDENTEAIRENIIEMKQAADRLGELTRKMQNITQYKIKEYIGTTKIIDIEKATNGI